MKYNFTQAGGGESNLPDVGVDEAEAVPLPQPHAEVRDPRLPLQRTSQQ